MARPMQAVVMSLSHGVGGRMLASDLRTRAARSEWQISP